LEEHDASTQANRLIGRVVSMRPVAPGVIVVPGNKPDRFVFSTRLVPGVEWGCLVTFTPRPPREEKLELGVAVDVVVALPVSEVPPYPQKPRPVKAKRKVKCATTVPKRHDEARTVAKLAKKQVGTK
jgi:hypothetical protein